MLENIFIFAYIIFGVSLIYDLIKELQKPEKKLSMVVFNILILIAVTYSLYEIFI
ncbi:Uncharacterized protein BC0861_04481 [Bacillus mobilis]|nr:Uncharacterized protein BC0861_04481 [Bacillus mobilis]